MTSKMTAKKNGATTNKTTAAKFFMYVVASLLVVLLGTSLGICFSRHYLCPKSAERWGCFVFLCHIVVMVPIELLYIWSENPPLILNPRALLERSRDQKWTPAAIYGNVTVRCTLSGLGVGMAVINSSVYLAYAAAMGHLLWQISTRRAFCEHKETVHLREIPPFSFPEHIVSAVDDVPLILISLGLYKYNNHFLWLLVGILIFAYSLLVRLGNWLSNEGPMTFLASLGGLICGALVLVPAGPFFARHSDGTGQLFFYLVGMAAPVLAVGNIVGKGVTRSQRILLLVFLPGFVFYLYFVVISSELDFSTARLFSQAECDASALMTLVAVFLLPFAAYVFLLTIAREADWLFPHQESQSDQNRQP